MILGFPKNNELFYLIEYDGEQHFKAREAFRGQKGDEVKNTYRKNNNIPLIRHPYWKYDYIEKILLDFLNSISSE